jgi:hypothetical protein
MIGGGFTLRKTYQKEESMIQSPTRLSQREVTRSIHRHHLKLNRPNSNAGDMISENDCKPWEIHKLEHM